MNLYMKLKKEALTNGVYINNLNTDVNSFSKKIQRIFPNIDLEDIKSILEKAIQGYNSVEFFADGLFSITESNMPDLCDDSFSSLCMIIVSELNKIEEVSSLSLVQLIVLIEDESCKEELYPLE